MKPHYFFLRFLSVAFLLSIFSYFETNAQIYNMKDTTVTHCTGTLFDTGGPGGNYGDNEDSVFTITVPGNSTITLNFVSFDTEANFDSLTIYDGPTSASPVLAGPFSGNTIPGNVTSTGQSISIRFESDVNTTESGYEISWDANIEPNVAFSTTPNPACPGDLVTFSVNDSSNAGNDPSFQWQVNGANMGVDSFAYTDNTLSNNDIVRVVMTPTAGGCYTKATDTASVTMTIDSNTPSVGMTLSAHPVCDGSNITFTVNDSTNGGANPTFQWQVNGANMGTDSYVYNNNTLNNGDVVRVIMTPNAVTCLTKPMDTASFTVTIHPNPSVSVTFQRNIDCNGNSTGEATALGTGGTGMIGYQWNSAPVQNVAAATNLPAGTFRVIATDANTCVDSAFATLTEPAVLNIDNFTINNVTSFGGNDGSLGANVSGGATPYNYSWNSTPVQTSQTASGLVSGTYVVTVTDDSSCVDVDSAFVDQPSLLVGGNIELNGSGTANICDGDNVGQFTSTDSSSGGIGARVHTWQASTDLLVWNSFINSDSAGNYTLNAPIAQNTFIRRRVVDAALDTAYSNFVFLNYIADVVLSITGINSPYCQNDSAVTMTGVPGGGMFVDYSNYSIGTTFHPDSATAGGANNPITYQYTDLNGCMSELTQQVVVNDTTAISFGFSSSFPPTAPLDTLVGSPAGGTFSGIGVSQLPGPTFVFDASIPPLNTPIGVTYDYTAPNGCQSSQTRFTQIQNTNSLVTGLPTDRTYCQYDNPDTISAVILTPPIQPILADNFYFRNITDNGPWLLQTEIAPGFPVPGVPGQIRLNPSTLVPANRSGAFKFAVRYEYIYQVIQVFPIFKITNVRINAIDTVTIVNTGATKLASSLPNSDGTSGLPFQYCENLTSVEFRGLHSTHPTFDNRVMKNLFSMTPNAGLAHANNSDTAFFDPSDPGLNPNNMLNYTYQDSISGCFTSLDVGVDKDVLPTVTLSGIDVANGYCSNSGTVVFTGNPYLTNQGTFSGTLPISHLNGLSFATFTPSGPLVGTHDVFYEFTEPSTGCSNTDSATSFAIDTVPILDFNLGPKDEFCLNDDSVQFSGLIAGLFSPGTGIIQGPGISDTTNSNSTFFVPQNAGVEVSPGHTITYSYTDANDCSNSIDTLVIVNDLPKPSFTPDKDYVCFVEDSVTFTPNNIPDANETDNYYVNGNFLTPLPGKEYNPIAILNSSGVGGTDTITRIITNSVTGCVERADNYIQINDFPVVSITVDSAAYCENEGAINFTFSPASHGNPSNESPQGDYVINNKIKIFSNAEKDIIAGVNIDSLNPGDAGPHIITYTHTDSITGCFRTVMDTVEILNIPTMTVEDFNPIPFGVYCYGVIDSVYGAVGDKQLVIDSIRGFGSTVIPIDTAFVFNTLIPSFPTGSEIDSTITYYYTDTNNCHNSTSKTVTIDRTPPVTLDLISTKGSPLCTDDGVFVQFSASPPGGFGASQSFVLNGIQNLAANSFRPNNDSSIVGFNVVNYTYTDAKQCSDSITDSIFVNPNPIAGFLDPSLCSFDTIVFIDTASILPGFQITNRVWDYGDFTPPDVVTSDTTKHLYASPGLKIVKLTVVSDSGCTADTAKPLTFGAPPNADFSWPRNAECSNAGIPFYNLTQVTTGDPSSLTYLWKFGDGDTTSSDSAIHTYIDGSDTHIVTLIANISNCSDSMVKVFTARPSISDFPYSQDFENGPEGWVLEYDFQNQSANDRWELGTPNATVINSANSGTSAWVTNLDGNYLPGDNTFVTSPCFDLSGLKRPMIRFWINHDLESNDGVVIQYSTDTSSNAVWKKLGDTEQNGFESGISWFNEDGIAASPGNQSPVEKNVGWTETSSGWVEARHDLDELLNVPYVRFRFALGSGADSTREGFAFDDIWIGERSKNILFETFTNTGSPGSNAANKVIDPILRKYKKDVLSIQYHTSFPEADPFNNNNQADPSARALYYSISEVPFVIMDGNQFKEAPIAFEEELFSLRSLEDPEFNIELETTQNGDELTINASLTGDAQVIQSKLGNYNPSDVTLHIAIIEDSVNITQLSAAENALVINKDSSFISTLKRMLPTAAGSNYIHTWLNGELETVSVNAQLQNFKGGNSDWKVIAFVQDNVTQEIYQAEYNDSGKLNTGVEFDGPVSDELDFKVYPNPTSDLTYFLFNKALGENPKLNIFNQLGALVSQQTLKENQQNYQLNTIDLKEGLYYLVVTNDAGLKISKKLIIAR